MSAANFPVSLRVVGWRPGFQKVSHTKALQEFAGLSLTQAKAATDAVLAGKTVQLALPSVTAAESLAVQLESLGAIAHVERMARRET